MKVDKLLGQCAHVLDVNQLLYLVILQIPMLSVGVS